jgi:hypothetical protein
MKQGKQYKILSQQIMLNYFMKRKTPPTYLHYNGSTKNPGLTLASDTAALASRNIIDDPGCVHRMIITTVNFKTTPLIMSGISKV